MQRKRKLVRTTVVLDDRLVREAVGLTGASTKRAVIHEALETPVAARKQERIWDLHGTVEWEGDLRAMRRARFGLGDC
jgi:Arc/MetJ family transcription regulator